MLATMAETSRSVHEVAEPSCRREAPNFKHVGKSRSGRSCTVGSGGQPACTAAELAQACGLNTVDGSVAQRGMGSSAVPVSVEEGVATNYHDNESQGNASVELIGNKENGDAEDQGSKSMVEHDTSASESGTGSTASGASRGADSSDDEQSDVMRSDQAYSPRKSAFASALDAFRGHALPEERVHAALSDCVDSSLHTLHVQSERHIPRTAAESGALDRAYLEASGVPRCEMLAWLLRALGSLLLPDNLLYQTTAILDRYYSSISKDSKPCREENSKGHQRMIAAVCISLKTEGRIDGDFNGRAVLHALCNGHMEVTDVFCAELKLLTHLRFDVTVPTAYDFLETLGSRLILGAKCPPSAISFANMLLHLSLADAGLHYRHPHAILAGASLSLSLWVMQAPKEVFEQLIEDVLVFLNANPKASFDRTQLRGALSQCAGGIHKEWCRISSDNASTYAYFVRQRFAHGDRFNVSEVMPFGAVA